MLITIGYAYATSTYAKQLGHAKDGCYFTATLDQELGAEDDVMPHSTWQEAKDRADMLGFPHSRYSMKVDPRT